MEVHSNAGRIAKAAMNDLTEIEGSYIHVSTFGTSCIFPKGYCGSTVNYLNEGDWVVSWAGDTAGMTRSKIDSNYADIVYMPRSSPGFMDNHDYDISYAPPIELSRQRISTLSVGGL